MKLTIATISFNQGAYIRECVESVLGQGVDGLEYVVVDAGSTDGSRELLREYEGGPMRLILESDRGPADGLNKAFSAARGDLLGYVNADDYYLPGALAQVLEAWASARDADVLYGDGSLLDQSTGRVRPVVSDPWSLGPYLRGATAVVQPATFFRREAYEASGGFNVANRTCWDGELLVALDRGGARFRHLCRRLAVFRLHAESISGSGRSVEQYEQDRLRLFRESLGRRPHLGDRLAGGVLRLAFGAHRRLLHRPGEPSGAVGATPK